ncbi:MAG TPA: hypothetical protein VE981_06060 [Planctomycetota bacterium]|nr:hypothetical protein [Planctomycetota bacterium]
MTRKMASNDPVTRGSLAAMRRAAKAAKALAIKTGTPFYVWRDGRVVNLNPRGRLKKARRPRPTG